MSEERDRTARSPEPSPIVQPAGRSMAIVAGADADLRLETSAAGCPTSPASASGSWTPTHTRSNSSSNYSPLSTFPSATDPVPARDGPPLGCAGDDTANPPQPTASASLLFGQDQSPDWSHMRTHASGCPSTMASQTGEHGPGDGPSDRAEGAAASAVEARADAIHHSLDRGHDDSAKTVDSHDLAWDQTRLRIAYLVSTMVVPPGNTTAGDDTGAGDASEPPSSSLQTPTVAAAAAAAAAAASLPDRAIVRRDPCPKIDVDPCPGGWPGVELLKKRRRITQIQRWCAEIAALGDGRTYCACSVGCAVPPGDGPVEECASPECTLREGPDADAAADNAGCSVPPASPSAPLSPSLSHSPSLSTPPSSLATAPATAPASTPERSSSLCEGCGHCLTPCRPFVFVGDAGMVRGSRTAQESAAQGLRKAFQGIRGLVSRKKEPSGSREEKRELSAQQQRQQREWNRNLARMRPWDQWHELNCQHTSGEFFTRTTMYGAHVSGGSSPTEAHRPALARRNTTAHGHDHDHDHGATNARVAELDRDNVSSSSASASGNANPQELERHRQREMDARLQRAQRLLAAGSDGRKAAASGQAPQLPPLQITTESFCM